MQRKSRVAGRTTIPLQAYGQRQIADRSLDRWTRTGRRLQKRIVRNYDDVVAGDPEVEFQRVHSGCDGIFESRDRILRTKCARSAMTVNLDRTRRQPGQQARQQEAQHESLDGPRHGPVSVYLHYRTVMF